jgi:hypothetical protein
MKANSVGNQVNISPIVRQQKATVEASKRANQAENSMTAAKPEQKAKTVPRYMEAQKSAQSARRAEQNTKQEVIKQSTKAMNVKTKSNGIKSNKLMVGLIAPPGSKPSSIQKLGQFIDKLA